MKPFSFLSSALVVLSPLMFSQHALADGWPTSVVGTWNVTANQTSGQLVITFQDTTGQCRKILGTIFGNSIVGFYCPSSGRIHFLRKDSSGFTIQDYSANLSQAGTKNYISGVFDSDLGSFGEYSFFGSK
ncbi:hypothetical protein [Nostoc sp. C117]|uniref:hypothetical protein n=1 Tax=Nostoc sp. C117 TaxID=3349875 RepID=UPI00370D9E0E